MKDWRRPGGAVGSRIESCGGSTVKLYGLGENGRGKNPDSRCVSIISATDGERVRRARWGSTTVESSFSRENALTCVGERLKTDKLIYRLMLPPVTIMANEERPTDPLRYP